MPFDPFGLREYHENVTRRIRDKEPGLAKAGLAIASVARWCRSKPDGSQEDRRTRISRK
jgi:hypothetical protein